MRIATVGYGMMGVWHSEALRRRGDVELRWLVGRRAEPAREFAERYGYARATTELDEALADPALDAVIVASPSEHHAAHAVRCLEAGKHVLLEIPIAMTLAEAERVVAMAERAGRTLALCHPMRARREREPLRARIAAGEEAIRHIAGRFFIHRLRNVGATGYARSWTDNILWHHFCHFIDLGCFLLGDTPLRRVQSHLAAIDPRTGIPMHCTVLVETEADQTLLVHGSYEAAFRLYDKLIVTDRDTYLYDILAATLRSRDGTAALEDEQTNCARVTDDFVDALLAGRTPLAPGRSVLPAMRILDAVQRDWDARHGVHALPGRPLPS
jgi:2-hydroxy-4-carboxymuconate semialdehyde hemiacetal dehydrogenase